MGSSKGGGYMKKDTLTSEQKTLLNQMLQQSNQNTQGAAAGYNQFLPGGGGGEAIKQQAMADYQQRTIPSILNSFSGAKGSSALNQALASSGADLNRGLSSDLSQMSLSAAQGLGNLGASQGQTGLNTPGFAYLQKQPPLWQQLTQSLLGVGGGVGKGWATGGFKGWLT